MLWRAKNSIFILLLTSGFLFPGAPAPAQVPTPAREQAQTPEQTPEQAPEKDKRPALAFPIPIGHSAQGVRIPIDTPEGPRQMLFDAEVAYRQDTEQLKLTALKVTTFDETGSTPQMVIELPLSFFDLKTLVLTREEPVTVRRDDLEIFGKNLVFNTQTRQGKFTGHVRVLVYQPPQEEEAK